MPAIRYLALGDSYTIGESVEEAERWLNQLAKLLERSPRFAGGGVEVTSIARTGWTTDELWQGIQARTVRLPYDLVSLLGRGSGRRAIKPRTPRCSWIDYRLAVPWTCRASRSSSSVPAVRPTSLRPAGPCRTWG